MRSVFSVAALLAFAGAALAQTTDYDPLSTPTKGEKISAGSTFEIQWEALAKYNGTATIILMAGASSTTLELGPTIAAGIDNSLGKYEWAVDSTLGAAATYGLKIQDDADNTIFQYSFPFQILAASGSASGSVSATGSTSAASGSATGSLTTITTTSAGTTSASGSAATTSVATTETTSVPNGNLSTTGISPKTITSVTTVGPSASKSTGASASTTSSVASSGANSLVAGSFALLGGIAMALLAL